MSEWFYSANQRQPQGPLAVESLVELYRSGRIGLDTLVWREGQVHWQPLGEFAAELGLLDRDGAALPPPLPPDPAYPTATPRNTTQARPHSTAPRTGLSGCLIALIVAAALAIPGLAILAAIALPAYQDYTLRAKVAGALPVADGIKAAVVAHLGEHPTCPGNDDPGFDAPRNYATAHVARATVGEFEGGRCGIELVLSGTGSDKVDGRALWFEYDRSDSSWHCRSEIDARYVPASCRQ